MSKDNKNQNTNPVKALREQYNNRRDETLKKARENAKKLPQPKKDERAAKPARSKRQDLEIINVK